MQIYQRKFIIEIPDCHREQPGNVLKLNKALYGLKQSPRQWNETLHDFLASQIFRRQLQTNAFIIR